MTLPPPFFQTSPAALTANALYEVLGGDNTPFEADKLAAAFDLPAVRDAVLTHYDARTADGMLVLLGRAFFSAWLREGAAQSLLTDWHFRLLPVPERIEKVLHHLCEHLETWEGIPCALRRAGDSLRWDIGMSATVAFFWQGVAFAAAAWSSGDKAFRSEVDPQSSPERCIIQVALQPFGN